MRYRETGNCHKDFHLATNTTINYVLKEYGYDFLKELFRRTAQRVFKEIYESLKKGDFEPLLEYWKYYHEREGGKHEVIRKEGEVVFHILECPAVKHLKERGVSINKNFPLQTLLLNEGWSEGTPFEITTELIGDGESRQVIRRKDNASQ